MSNYYYKFDSGLNLDKDLQNYKGKNSFNFISGDSALLYCKINDMPSLAEKFFNKRIFSIDPHLIYYAEVQGPGQLDPHRDHGVKTVANFYFESNSSVTTFYEPKPGIESINYEGAASVQESNIYNINDLDAVASFCANDGESYLLDVSKIHGVYTRNKGYRRFINMQWYGVDIDTLYQSIINK